MTDREGRMWKSDARTFKACWDQACNDLAELQQAVKDYLPRAQLLEEKYGSPDLLHSVKKLLP